MLANAGSLYADNLQELIQYSTSGNIAGFTVEPIQGVGGTVVMPKDFLQKTHQLVKQAGGL